MLGTGTALGTSESGLGGKPGAGCDDRLGTGTALGTSESGLGGNSAGGAK